MYTEIFPLKLQIFLKKNKWNFKENLNLFTVSTSTLPPPQIVLKKNKEFQKKS